MKQRKKRKVMFFCESSVIAYTVSCFQAQGKIQEGQIKRKKDCSSIPVHWPQLTRYIYQSGSVLIPLTVLCWNLRKQNQKNLKTVKNGNRQKDNNKRTFMLKRNHFSSTPVVFIFLLLTCIWVNIRYQMIGDDRLHKEDRFNHHDMSHVSMFSKWAFPSIVILVLWRARGGTNWKSETHFSVTVDPHCY